MAGTLSKHNKAKKKVFLYCRLAKSISSQIKDRLNKSHEAFSHALRQLEMKHSGRLDKIEEDRLKLRKVYAPRVAKVALESTSLKDVISHGKRQFRLETCEMTVCYTTKLRDLNLTTI